MKGWADLEATCSWLFRKNNIKHFQGYRLCIMSFDLYVQGHSLGGICNKDYAEEKKLEKEAFEKKIGLLTYVGQSAIESRGRCVIWYARHYLWRSAYWVTFYSKFLAILNPYVYEVSYRWIACWDRQWMLEFPLGRDWYTIGFRLDVSTIVHQID